MEDAGSYYCSASNVLAEVQSNVSQVSVTPGQIQLYSDKLVRARGNLVVVVVVVVVTTICRALSVVNHFNDAYMQTHTHRQM